MQSIGFCTHFTETDEWAFAYALHLAQLRGWQLNICHWLESPYRIRRDIVYTDFFEHQKTSVVGPKLLQELELKLREYYEPKLANFTNVAFKLCEGAYQVELVRCLRQHLLDIVVMGYQKLSDEFSDEQPLELFAAKLQYPVVIVGYNGPDTFLLNDKAAKIYKQLGLAERKWQALNELIVSR
ncbi:MAG: hypothetical protein D6706_16225 [Chloroflexi bacterium]|nr:MAG: hypothetical protein D6706_16225 [Chloroflexota bacterium]